MAFRFTEQHAMSLVAPLLYPGEQVLFRARGLEKPLWTMLFWRFGSLFWRYYLVVATNQRLVYIQHATLLGGYQPKQSQTFAWSELDEVKLGWGIFNKTLRAKSAAKRFARKVIVPRFWMKGNFDAAQGALGAWQQNRNSLPPAAMPHALHAPQAYGAPAVY